MPFLNLAPVFCVASSSWFIVLYFEDYLSEDNQSWNQFSIILNDYSWGYMSKHLLIPDREPTTDQSTDIRVQLGEPVDFIRAVYRSMDGGLLTGAENDRCTTKTHPSMGDSLWNPECTAWPKGSSPGLVWASSRQFNLSKCGSGPYCLHVLRKVGAWWVSFRDTPNPFELFSSWA